MKLLDRIALNNLLRIIKQLIITMVNFFEKQKQLPKPKPVPNKPRPIKKIIDLIPVPWRSKDE